MIRDTILCLCDITGYMAEPWVTFGYNALLVDPQHWNYGEGAWLKFPGSILEAMPLISLLLPRLAFVAGFPPCTDVAASGARWWDDKRRADPYFQARATGIAEQCRTIGELSGAPWIFENPIGAFGDIFGPPAHIFDPFDYAGYCEADQYSKKTCLWTGGGFVMPPPAPRGSLGEPDERIHKASENEERANFRSATPRGFANAVFLYNCPELQQ